MSTLLIRTSTVEDIKPIADNARQADRLETWRMSHETMEEALARGLRQSAQCYTAEVDGEPIAMFGVVPVVDFPRVGIVWLLGTDGISKHRRLFMMASKPSVAKFRRRYLKLINFVDAENLSAIRWLRWLGFTIYPAKPAGRDNVPFHFFEVT